MTDTEMKNHIDTLYINREPNSIKSDYGRSLLIGGSVNYPNAIVISSILASYAGNGYCGIMVPNKIYPIIASRVRPTQIFEQSVSAEGISFEKETLSKIIKTYQSILFGNGIVFSEETFDSLKKILSDYEGNLVIDATGIRLVAFDPHMLKRHKGKVLLTPHLGEAAALLKMKNPSRNPEDYFDPAKKFASDYQVYILLKSSASYLVCPDGRILHADYEPTACLGKAGSGDGLAGYITGLLAYADKKIGYENTILFADQMIHAAAKKAQEKYSAGIADILYAAEELKTIVNEK